MRGQVSASSRLFPPHPRPSTQRGEGVAPSSQRRECLNRTDASAPLSVNPACPTRLDHRAVHRIAFAITADPADRGAALLPGIEAAVSRAAPGAVLGAP